MSRDPLVERAFDLTLENWQALGVVEHEQHGLLLPSKLRTRSKEGRVTERDVMLMMVDRPRRIAARQRARKWATDLGLDPRFEPDAVQGGGEDRDLVRELENFEIMAYAIRDAEPPYDQSWPDGRSLYSAFQTPAPINELFAHLDTWTRLNDACYGELNPEQTWEVINRIAREGHPLPLGALDGVSQLSCTVVMARAAMRSPTCPLRLRWPTD